MPQGCSKLDGMELRSVRPEPGLTSEYLPFRFVRVPARLPRLAALTLVLILFFNGDMPKPPPWYYDPKTQPAPLLAAMAELRLCCTRASMTVPFIKERGSSARIEAIMQAIDDFAECEMGARQFFWAKAHGRGVG